jgi:FixJ family two-component response regulator
MTKVNSLIKNKCVFVVDDDPSARKGLTRLLRTSGYDVRDFASAEEFLDAIGSEDSGCVVLDARMEGLSFAELLEELKACGIHLPIIVITADDDPEIRRKAHEMNAAGFFRKPIDGPALCDAIDWALGSYNKDHKQNKT